MKIFTVLGARPQFIKAAPVSKLIRNSDHKEIIIHTGQHYDYNMTEIFFDELGIAKPKVNIAVGSGPHGWQTGQMLIRIEEVLMKEKPDCMLVYGDTNSTIAGALAAVKHHIPVAHVEAGLRSFNREMPEGHNRVLTDHCSDLLFCPTRSAFENLKREGISKGVHLTGDTMYDTLLQFSEIAAKRSTILQDLNLNNKEYCLATIHRPYNVDNPENLWSILSAFTEIERKVIFPAHPRTKEKIARLDMDFMRLLSTSNVIIIEPVGYFDMLMLEQNANLILTDSGGMQKEAYFFGVPCVTLRSETEWVETVDTGWSVLVGTDRSQIIQMARSVQPPPENIELYGNGNASEKILAILEDDPPVRGLH